LHDYFAGGFDGESEMLMVVHGEIGRGLANSFRERLMRIGQDFLQPAPGRPANCRPTSAGPTPSSSACVRG
jgi:hypothetical protein